MFLYERHFHYRGRCLLKPFLFFAFLTVSLSAWAAPDAGLERNSASSQDSLIGVITNSKGVRDDVSAYLDRTYGQDPKKLLGASALARSSQRILEAVATNKPATSELLEDIATNLNCFTEGFGGGNMANFAYEEIMGRSYNSPARVKARALFNKSASGMMLEASEVPNPCSALK